jgi:hypothetical protein
VYPAGHGTQVATPEVLCGGGELVCPPMYQVPPPMKTWTWSLRLAPAEMVVRKQYPSSTFHRGLGPP